MQAAAQGRLCVWQDTCVQAFMMPYAAWWDFCVNISGSTPDVQAEGGEKFGKPCSIVGTD